MDSMQLFLFMDAHFVGTVHMNVHAKSGVCSSKNERVMALGTKEDGHSLSIYSLYSSDYTVQTYFCEKFESLDNNKLREESGISISLKVHYIFDHLEDLLDMTGHGLNTVDDHTVECMHQHLHKRMQNSNYYVKDLSSEDHGEKKLHLILHINGTTSRLNIK